MVVLLPFGMITMLLAHAPYRLPSSDQFHTSLSATSDEEARAATIPQIPKPSSLHPLLQSSSNTSQTTRFHLVPQLFQSLPPPSTLNSSLPVTPSSKHTNNPGRKRKATYAAIISYHGPSFPGGYESNPTLTAATVEARLIDRFNSVYREVAPQLPPSHSTNESERTTTTTPPIRRMATAGRTDARVSARGALVSFVTPHPIPEDANQAFLTCVNSLAEERDLTVQHLQRVDSSFHATFCTVAREYLYVLPLLSSDSMLPFTSDVDRVAHVCTELLRPVVGVELDYFGMSAGNPRTKSNVCTLQTAACWGYDREGCVAFRPFPADETETEVVPGFGASWKQLVENDAYTGVDVVGCLAFRIKGDRFLRRMVRKVINSVLQEAAFVLGQGDGDTLQQQQHGWEQNWKRRVELKDRSQNEPAPSEGLCLWSVEVGENISKSI